LRQNGLSLALAVSGVSSHARKLNLKSAPNHYLQHLFYHKNTGVIKIPR
jgi:hypothetical protein